ncbi:MAG: hypothetical protein WBX25_07570 [Rhodomicrobium sp.]
MAEGIVDGEGEDIPGHRLLDGTDLEISYNLSGDGLVLRVNKGPVMIFRVLLRDAAKDMSYEALADFSTVVPDFVFRIGDTRERMYQLAKGVGLDDEQLEKLKTKLLG